jgi:hypothetical protein
VHVVLVVRHEAGPHLVGGCSEPLPSNRAAMTGHNAAGESCATETAATDAGHPYLRSSRAPPGMAEHGYIITLKFKIVNNAPPNVMRSIPSFAPK